MHRLKKKFITHFYVADYFRKNKRDGIEEQEEQITTHRHTHTHTPAHPRRTQNEAENCILGMAWLQGGLIYGLANWDNRVSNNVQHIRYNYKLYYEYHRKLEDGIDCGKSNSWSDKNTKNHLLERLTLATIMSSNHAIQLHSKEVDKGYIFTKSKEKISHEGEGNNEKE